MSGRRTILVAGAAGALGSRVARRLAVRGDHVIAGYRTERTEPLAALEAAGCTLERLDLADVARAAERIAVADAAVLTPILTVSGPAARAALVQGAGRLVAFSSNNVAIDAKAPVYQRLAAEEAALAALGGDWMLIRPTMIYGHAEDGNASRLIRAARRWPVLPLPGAGRARQQPIHVDDLADLAVHLLDVPPPPDETGRAATAAGPDVVSLRALYEAAARAAGRSERVVTSVPLALLRPLAHALGRRFPLSPEQLARIAEDKTPAGSPPPGWRAAVTLEAGLARLAEELGLDGSA